MIAEIEGCYLSTLKDYCLAGKILTTLHGGMRFSFLSIVETLCRQF